jgi:hypothetical protein
MTVFRSIASIDGRTSDGRATPGKGGSSEQRTHAGEISTVNELSVGGDQVLDRAKAGRRLRVVAHHFLTEGRLRVPLWLQPSKQGKAAAEAAAFRHDPMRQQGLANAPLL